MIETPTQPDELIIVNRHAAEHLHGILDSLSPEHIGTRLYHRLENKLAVLYGELEPYQPFGPY